MNEKAAAQAGEQDASRWSAEAGELLQRLGVDAETGLDPAESARRLRRFGPNLLQVTKPRSAPAILADQFRSIVVLLLLIAALASMLYGDHVEGLAVLAVVFINTAIGFVTELRATRSMEALRTLGQFETVVRRGGRLLEVAAAELVPGDIVVAEGGDIITADLRLLKASRLSADESTLTGESLPVGKQVVALAARTPLTDRRNMLFKGTSLARGSAEAVVVGTGADTELGRIARLVSDAETQETPLERRLDMLGRRLVCGMLAIAVFIAVAGMIAGRDTVLAIQVAVALTVAAIPEGLPIVATIALARGMWRMARRRALIVRLSAVETLGATSVILTDKTGTLTENRMTVTRLELPGESVTLEGTGLDLTGRAMSGDREAGLETLSLVDELLVSVTLCSNAELHREGGEVKAVGDPTETALLVAAAKRGIFREELAAAMPELREEPFDTDTKAMATYNRAGDEVRVSVKGAAEAVLPACDRVRTARGDVPLDEGRRAAILARVEALGELGLRTLAVATREDSDHSGGPYRQLAFQGVVGLLDPPRAGVRESIGQCREAGIRVVMVTGDHLATARNVAAQIGLLDEGTGEGACIDAAGLDDEEVLEAARLDRAVVIARATPAQKLRLIDWYQSHDRVVAMTGDGVNDAPALKKADIGVAMGLRGTPVAKEAAAMVLQDDRFMTIVAAVRQGRAIYENIQRFVLYLLSCNISEILVVGLATVAGAPLPLLPLQILFLNLVTDVFPALALGVGQGSDNLMRRRPRPAREPLVTRQRWALIFAYGVLMGASVLGAMAFAVRVLGMEEGGAVTVSFCTLAFGQLWHVHNMRDRESGWWRNEITRNPWMWAAVALCVLLILVAVFLPGLQALLHLRNPGAAGWLAIAAFSLLPLAAGRMAHRVAAALFPEP